MKKIFFIVPFVLGIAVSLNVVAQEMGGTMYVAAKTGLSIREKPDAAAKVLDKIPYGTKITLLELEEERKSNTSEGMLGFWQKVSYKNKTGFVLDSYLLPWASPKLATIKDMKNYLAQVTVPFGAKLTVKSGKMNNLTEAGWQVTTASNGQQALEKAKADRPSIVFLDIVMPEVDGYMTSRMLSEDAATKGIPVVFVSTKNTRVDQVWARAQGGKALIGKPYTSDQIVDALKFAA